MCVCVCVCIHIEVLALPLIYIGEAMAGLVIGNRMLNVKQSSVGWCRPGLEINFDTVRRGPPVDIQYYSLLNEAWDEQTPTTPGQPHPPN